MSTVIGIDPSLTGLAICVYLSDERFYVNRFTSTPPEGPGLASRFARYDAFVKELMRFVETVPPPVKAILIEGYSFASTGRVIVLAEFGGVFRRELLGCPIRPIVEVPPSTLKLFALGKGGGKGADKLAVCLALQKRYGVSFSTNDEYDAYALARLGACCYGMEEPATDFQRRAVNSVLNPPQKKQKKKGGTL